MYYFFLQSSYKKGETRLTSQIKPPVLLSRLLTLVFVVMLVITGTLFFTLYKLYPLEKPQIFFLTTQPREGLLVSVAEMPPIDDNFELYKRSFVREYIKARNEVFANQKVMRKKWGTEQEGVVRAWSTPEVYSAFATTKMWNALMSNIPDFEFSCPVEFQPGSVTPRTENSYSVTFTYFCGDGAKKSYTIVVELEMDDLQNTKWSDRLVNPLGLRVSKYEVVSGNGDPLDTGFLQ